MQPRPVPPCPPRFQKRSGDGGLGCWGFLASFGFSGCSGCAGALGGLGCLGWAGPEEQADTKKSRHASRKARGRWGLMVFGFSARKASTLTATRAGAHKNPMEIQGTAATITVPMNSATM